VNIGCVRRPPQHPNRCWTGARAAGGVRCRTRRRGHRDDGRPAPDRPPRRWSVVPPSPRGVDRPAAPARLRAAATLTLVDRLVVGIAPTIIWAGTEAVGTLGIINVADGIRLVDRSVHVLDDDMLLALDVARCRW